MNKAEIETMKLMFRDYLDNMDASETSRPKLFERWLKKNGYSTTRGNVMVLMQVYNDWLHATGAFKHLSDMMRALGGMFK